MRLNQFVKILAGTILVTGVLVQARAEDKKVDPSGTYVWSIPARNGGADRTNTLVLKLAGDKLTGKLSAPGRGGQINSTDIMDGKVAGADVSFCVVRTFNENTVTNKFSGKLADGVIKGKIEYTRNGEPQSRDWEARAEKK
jgi:hypothetical protein